MKQPKIQFILLILVWLNVSNLQMVNTFHSEMARTSQEQQGMLQSIPILVTSNQEEMISRLLLMCCCTFWKVPSLGKDCLADLRPRSTPTSRRRRRRLQSRNYARTNQKNSKSSSTTAEVFHSPKTLITATSLACLKAAWRETTSIWELQTSFGIRIVLLSKRKQSKDKWWVLSRRRRPEQVRKKKLQHDQIGENNSFRFAQPMSKDLWKTFTSYYVCYPWKKVYNLIKNILGIIQNYDNR